MLTHHKQLVKGFKIDNVLHNQAELCAEDTLFTTSYLRSQEHRHISAAQLH